MEKSDDSETPITGYIHSVSPMKTSKKNNKYFNATIQTAREQYHQAVFYTPQKHSSIQMAERKKTPIKLNNARKKIGKYKFYFKIEKYFYRLFINTI